MGRRVIAPTERQCKRCLVTKPIDDFPLQNTTRKGMTWHSYRHSCKKCESLRTSIKRNQYFADGFCYCGRTRCVESKSYCAICRQRRIDWEIKNPTYKTEESIRYRQKLKQTTFEAYGNACACCGDTTYEFLEIDHVGGWGKDHRNKDGHRICGQALYRWLKRHNYPKDTFRLLCGSCHGAISYHGYCPHQKQKQLEATTT